jgi:intracellular sulfur oxidation DsrE/DsrF family protein
VLVISLGIGGVLAARGPGRVHHVVFQVNSDDPVPMKHAISNALNLVRHFPETQESTEIEIVAYGPGITMFRADISPVRDILGYVGQNFPEVRFTICGNSKAIIEQREGHAMPLIQATEIVPFGIVRVVERQEAGWTYIRP